jgi:hypothetical protein
MAKAPKAHRFFPNTPEYKAAMTAAYKSKYGTEPPAGYFGSRNDGMEAYVPNTGTDSDFGSGYEVVDPAPSRGLDKRGARAQKLGYNRELKYLVILMRDGSFIGYDGVTPDEWDSLENFVSTTDYIESVLSRYQGGAWDKVYGQPPQSTGQSFEQGMQD